MYLTCFHNQPITSLNLYPNLEQAMQSATTILLLKIIWPTPTAPDNTHIFFFKVRAQTLIFITDINARLQHYIQLTMFRPTLTFVV